MTEIKRNFTSLYVFVIFTAVWVALFAIFNLGPFYWIREPFAYSTYVYTRGIGLVLILILTGLALRRAYSYAGETPSPWYKDGFLLAAVCFWALFPPTWFFTEFALFEHGSIVLQGGSLCDPYTESPACERELGRLKAYADLAAKIWAGMAALFASTVALSKRS